MESNTLLNSQINRFTLDRNKVLSFSKISTYYTCPYMYKMLYIDKIKTPKSNVYNVAGKIFHLLIQNFIEQLFKRDISKKELIQMYRLKLFDYTMAFYEETIKNIDDESREDITKNISILSNYFNGYRYLFDYFVNNLDNYFNLNEDIFIANELEILQPFELDKDYYINGQIDMIIKNKHENRYSIIDIKLVKYDFDTDDEVKKMQLPLYKYYFAKQVGLDVLDTIDCYYYIFRNATQTVKKIKQPSSTKTINSVNKKILNFIIETNSTTEFKKNKSNLCSYCSVKKCGQCS